MFSRPKKTELITKKLRPEILCQPNVPKPLHGLNPRTVLGKEWWDKTRLKAQSDANFKCVCCGVSKNDAKEHQWLEGHEAWDLNHKTGICEVTEILPLCHYCHNFIHNGRLYKTITDSTTLKKAKDVMEHGFKILEGKNLKVFPGAIEVAYLLDVSTRGVTHYDTEYSLPWHMYKMKLEGKLYDSLFADYSEWEKHYAR